MNWTNPFFVDKMELEVTIVYEGDVKVGNEMKHSYSLSWEDTLGLKSNYEKFNRPYELHVVVRDKDTIAGHYTGLSTQFTHCIFFTNSRSVNVYFFRARNRFYSSPQPIISASHRQESEEISIEVLKTEITSFDFNNRNYAEYEPVRVNLRRNNGNFIDGFNEKKMILAGNERIVTLNHVNKGAMFPDEMPRLGPLYCNILALDRFQINEENGRIRKGEAWIAWRGIKKCCDISFLVIDPHLTYEDVRGKKYYGKKLARKRKLSSEEFDFNQFRYITKSLPY